MKRQDRQSDVPPAMLVQLAKLFGTDSKAAQQRHRSSAQWKTILRQVLREIGRYLDENVTSDEMHMMMLYSGLAAAEESLKTEDFWPGYTEGITRLALLLMGDYPDHRRRKPGRKIDQHYKLTQHRTLKYIQDDAQRVHTLLSAFACGHPRLTRDPRDVLGEFRDAFGSRATYKEFIRWFKEKYPGDYAALF